MTASPMLAPAVLKYPATRVTHSLTPDNTTAWYQYQLPNGRIAVVVWLYEGTDPMRRTVVARLWGVEDSPIHTQGHVRLGGQEFKGSTCDISNNFLDKLAAF